MAYYVLKPWVLELAQAQRSRLLADSGRHGLPPRPTIQNLLNENGNQVKPLCLVCAFLFTQYEAVFLEHGIASPPPGTAIVEHLSDSIALLADEKDQQIPDHPEGLHKPNELRPDQWQATIRAMGESLVRASQRGLVNVFNRSDDVFRARIVKAVERTKERLWICGRTHHEMLICKGDPGWLLEPTIRDLCRRQSIDFRLMLGDGFGSDGNGKGSSLKQAAHRDQDGWLNSARGTVVSITAYMADHLGNGEFGIRIADQQRVVPYAMLVTDKALFVEPYLPSVTGGGTDVLEYVPCDGGTFEKCVDDFAYHFDKWTSPLEAMKSRFQALDQEEELPRHLDQFRRAIAFLESRASTRFATKEFKAAPTKK